jgi:hypothetical protein
MEAQIPACLKGFLTGLTRILPNLSLAYSGLFKHTIHTTPLAGIKIMEPVIYHWKNI